MYPQGSEGSASAFNRRDEMWIKMTILGIGFDASSLRDLRHDKTEELGLKILERRGFDQDLMEIRRTSGQAPQIREVRADYELCGFQGNRRREDIPDEGPCGGGAGIGIEGSDHMGLDCL